MPARSTPERPLFAPGRLTATPGALQALAAAAEDPISYLARHVRGDWGVVDQEDRAANRQALLHGTRIVSAYNLATGRRLWIITEADRSVTTLLLPEEY